ncbi:hypothetical protein GX50_01981 [[Emmonsia] crescens]|uniref:Uncharacterized protein n=1 Tax=[Emmonsia] crescens TaxID=73230 RepID=A0A2B7ZPQ6_9EURO|nr:hypothetical protein GX50_01981 [Emmonsia crescens]
MSFAALPVELLFEVASYLKLECDINSFALANHRLYMILNPYLLKYHVTQNGGESALIWAAQTGNEALARSLLSYNDAENNRRVNPNCQDAIYGLCPLSFAAIKGLTNIVKLLHGTPGIDLDPVNEIRRTPISFAAEKGHVEIVKLLMMDKISLSVTNDWARRTSLLWATSPRPLLGDDGELYRQQLGLTIMKKSSQLRVYYDH